MLTNWVVGELHLEGNESLFEFLRAFNLIALHFKYLKKNYSQNPAYLLGPVGGPKKGNFQRHTLVAAELFEKCFHNTILNLKPIRFSHFLAPLSKMKPQ